MNNTMPIHNASLNNGSNGHGPSHSQSVSPHVVEVDSPAAASVNPAMPLIWTRDATAQIDQKIQSLLASMLATPLKDATRAPAPLISHTDALLPVPTMLTGSGGSGRHTLTHAKAGIWNRYGCMPANGCIRAIDSSNEKIHTTDAQGRIVQLEKESEFLHLSMVPLAGIKLNPQLHEELFERMGETLFHILPSSLFDGAMQQRAQALVNFYFFFEKVARSVRLGLKHIFSRDLARVGQDDDGTRAHIIDFTSSGGGFGSGFTLDMAELVNFELSKMAARGLTTRRVLVSFLPGVHGDLANSSEGRLLIPNTYAFFRELQYKMQGHRSETLYPGRVRVQSAQAPYNHIFVVDAIDEGGETRTKAEEIYATAARAIELLFCSPLGLAQNAHALNSWGNRGPDRNLATFGLAEISFPGAQMATRCTAQQALALVNVTLEEGAEALPAAPFGALADLQAHLHAEKLEARLQIPLPADIEQGEVSNAPQRTRAYVEQFLRHRLYGEAFTEVERQAAALMRDVQTRVTRWHHQIGTSGRVLLAAHALTAARQHILALLLAQRPLRHAAEVALEDAHAALETSAKAMDEAAQSLWFGQRSRTLNAVQRYLQGAAESARLELKLQRHVMLGQTLQQLEQQLTDLEAEAAESVRRLRQVQELFGKLVPMLAARQQNATALVLDDDSVAAYLSAHYAHAPANDVQQIVAADTLALLRCGAQRAEEVARWLVRAAAPAFVPIVTLSVETVMQTCYPHHTPGDWLRYLAQKVGGVWAVDLAKVPPSGSQLASFITVGVPDATQTLFQESGYDLRTTGDPQRVVALKTHYGARFDDLQQADQWREIYEATVATERPSLHLLSHFQPGVQEVEQWFILGRVFGLIARKGKSHHFVYVPADALLQPPHPLGNSQENALVALRSESTLRAEVMERIRSQLDNCGRVAARQQILDFVHAEAKHKDVLTIHLLQLARDFAEELVGSPMGSPK